MTTDPLTLLRQRVRVLVEDWYVQHLKTCASNDGEWHYAGEDPMGCYEPYACSCSRDVRIAALIEEQEDEQTDTRGDVKC